MEIFFWILCVVIFHMILYYVIKIAVRNAIVEARSINDNHYTYGEDEESGISKTICPSCGKRHDIDYPKCPFCKHQYS